ncbi:MAG: dephospho-CoA kinase [Pirellulales bacterium]
MQIIGIVGGIASGKSLVAEQFQSLGAGLLDGDRAGHEVLKDAEVCRQIRDRWGPGVFDQEGNVVRSELARIVFGAAPEGPRELRHLESITHPRIRAALERQKLQLEQQGYPAAVLDAPVLFKAGWETFCDIIVYVEAPTELRLARALRRGWSKEDFYSREAAQEPLEWKRGRADRVIDNSGSVDATRSQVAEIWHSLRAAD